MRNLLHPGILLEILFSTLHTYLITVRSVPTALCTARIISEFVVPNHGVLKVDEAFLFLKIIPQDRSSRSKWSALCGNKLCQGGRGSRAEIY